MNLGEGSIAKFKVGHPNVSNNIVQMRSAGFQAPFIAGGNSVAYYLGKKGNYADSCAPHSKDKTKKSC
jgi:hypothetical protein